MESCNLWLNTYYEPCKPKILKTIIILEAFLSIKKNFFCDIFYMSDNIMT
jgi:hypothetical protein